ncbi:cobalt-precorrin-6y c5-methyltransferase [hydrocarbon metagenome]|uniref:Cobalt-precorrin-6y c5-methyltransferase n=1 Tax=hydrocarbon metagenome TaxID=938273 RepID=A0A0W8EAF1_9ZZZZ
MTGIVQVVGTGPGNPAYITPLALQTIRSAEVLVGGGRLLDTFAEREQIQVIIKQDLAGIVSYLQKERFNKKIVVLVSGDTGIFSFADYLLKNMDREVLEFIPGVSSLQLMFARLKRSWVEAQILSMHGRCMDLAAEVVRHYPLTALLTGTPWSPQKIASHLLSQDLPDLMVAVGKDLSYTEERIEFFTLKALACESRDFNNSIMVIFNE